MAHAQVSRIAVTCSICGNGDLSRNQQNKPEGVRRCYSCVDAGVIVFSTTHAAQHNQRRHVHNPREGESENDCDPVGIDISVVEAAGNRSCVSVKETQTMFGRSVNLTDGARYMIIVENNTDVSKRNCVAVVVTVDGRKVSPTPILVGCRGRSKKKGVPRQKKVVQSRRIRGFTESRQTVESVDDEGNTVYTIAKETGLFAAAACASNRSTHLDSNIGTIHVDFFGVRYDALRPGRRTRNHTGHQGNFVPQGQSRDGVLGTRSIETIKETGEHRDARIKPMCDFKCYLGSTKLTICEGRRSVLADFDHY